MSTAASNKIRSPGAIRFARYYRRQKMNRAIMQIEVDVGALAELLIRRKFLLPWDAEDRAAIQRALEEYIQIEARYQ